MHGLYLFPESRLALSGMKITGSSGTLSDEVLLYQDDGSVTSCQDSTISVCNMSVHIALNVNREVRDMKISISDKMREKMFAFYEVQVYAGTLQHFFSAIGLFVASMLFIYNGAVSIECINVCNGLGIFS